MNRRQTRQRRRQAVPTIVLLLLLQIFNGVDWNCPAGSHHPCGDACCRQEHLTEAICQQDESNLLEAVWMQIHLRPTPFFLPPLFPDGMMSAGFSREQKLSAKRDHAPPTEELQPLRC